jgi:hypothetical protein
MFRVFLEVAFVTAVTAWVLAKVLSALGRWSDKHSNSEPALGINMDATNHRDERVFGAPDLVVAIVLLFLLLMPSTVTSNGQLLSLQEISYSMVASKDVGTLATFVGAWRAEEPLKFWGLSAGLLVTVISLFRRSPALLGVAVIASFFTLWLKMQAGISTLR